MEQSIGVADVKRTFRHVMSIIMRRVWVAVAVFVGLFSIGVLRIARSPNIYRADVQVLVEKQSPRALSTGDGLQPVAGWGREFHNTQVKLVTSEAVLKIALERPGIAEMFATHPDARESEGAGSTLRESFDALLGVAPATPLEPWEQLRGMVLVQSEAETHFIKVMAESQDARVARLVANSVAEAYSDFHLRRRQNLGRDTFSYLKEQRDAEEASLKTALRELEKFREVMGSASFGTSDTTPPVLYRLDALNRELTETRLKEIEARASLLVMNAALEQADGDDSAELFGLEIVKASETLSTLRAQLMSARQLHLSLASIYGAEHPSFIRSVETLISLKSEFDRELAEVRNGLDVRLEMLLAQRASLQTRYDEEDAVAVKLAKSSATFARLKNTTQRHQTLLDVLAKRMREIDLSSKYDRTNVQIIEYASMPKSPIRPQKMNDLAEALVLAMLMALAIPLVLERLNNRIKTPEDLRARLKAPVLGFVPAVGVTGEEAVPSHVGCIVVREPQSSAVEAYRNIRTSLQFAMAADKRKVIVVTSGEAGDGKTTTASNIALSMALGGKRVLLIDADLRRPMLHKIFKVSRKYGLSGLLMGKHSFDKARHSVQIQGAQLDNLDLVVAGEVPDIPVDLIEAQMTQSLIKKISKNYDMVIIDAPPVLFVSDACILAGRSDGVVVVSRADRNSHTMMAQVVRQLEGVGANVLGGILNGVRVSKMGAYYSEYYSHGYYAYKSDYYSTYQRGRSDASQSSEDVG